MKKNQNVRYGSAASTYYPAWKQQPRVAVFPFIIFENCQQYYLDENI